MSMSSLGVYNLNANPADLASSASVIAYLTSASGGVITSVSINGNESLRVVQPSNFQEDAPHTSGDYGQFTLAVRNDTEGSLVSANGDYAPLQVDALGRLRVNADINVNNDFVFAEDAPNASGDLGAHILAVRQDTLATSTSADGDFASFKVNALGALYVTGSVVVGGAFTEDSVHASGDVGLHTLSVRKDALSTNVSADGDYASNIQWSEGSLKVVDIPNISAPVAAVSVLATETSLGAPIANRRSTLIQNRGDKSIFLGPTGVTTATGIEVPKGASITLDFGPAVTFFGITSSGTADVRVMQFS